jgi:prevent-host-death family protein
MDAKSNTWKLQDAKARFSEVVRRARAGEPQHVTLHGREAVMVIDPQRFDVRPKAQPRDTLADFVEASKKYRGAAEGISFERRTRMPMRDKRPEIFDGEFSED